MKKLLALSVVLFVSTSAFAANINLGTFPTGKWLDANYDAVWEFSVNNIRILSTSGAVLYDFSTKTVNDLKVGLDGTSPVLSFTCPESERTYRFVKKIAANTDLVLEISRSGYPPYSVTMKMQ